LLIPQKRIGKRGDPLRIEHLIIKYKEGRGYVVSYHERSADQAKRSTKTHEADLFVGFSVISPVVGEQRVVINRSVGESTVT
jgi:hypothetical protein